MVKDRAKELGVSKSTASRIRAGLMWKDYTSPFAALIR
jgi:DNA-binding LacI/PurR family transcriptional regulator